MKKLSLILVLCNILFVGYSQQKYTIYGNVKGLETGTVIRLTSQNKLVATDTVVNETFKFSDTISLPSQKMGLIVFAEGFPPTWLDIWVAPETTTTITGNDKLLRTWNVQSNIKEQMEQNQYISACRDYIINFQKAFIENSSLIQERDKTESPDDKNKIQQRIDSLNTITNAFYQKIEEIEIGLLKSSSISPFGLAKLYDHSIYSRYNKSYQFRDDVLALYNRLSEEQKKTGQGKDIYANLFPPVEVKEGDSFVDGIAYDPKGKAHHLSDYKGKYILLNIWSAYCGYCELALSDLREVKKIYKNKLTIIGLNINNKAEWLEASKKEKIPWVNLNDYKLTNGLAGSYGATIFPNFVLIGKNGTIDTSWTGRDKDELMKRLEKVIK